MGASLVVNNQSAKFWPNFHFRGRGKGFSRVVKTYTANFWPNFKFLGSQNSKCQVLANFSFPGGREGGSLLKNRVFLVKWAKNTGSLTCSCIADSLSHSTFVETNKGSLNLDDERKLWLYKESYDTKIMKLVQTNFSIKLKRACQINNSLAVIYVKKYHIEHKEAKKPHFVCLWKKSE